MKVIQWCTFSVFACSLMGCSLFIKPDPDPMAYPTLANSHYSGDEIPLNKTANVINSAVVAGRTVPISDKERVNQKLPLIFAEIGDRTSIRYQVLSEAGFHSAIKNLVTQYSCHLYASQQTRDTVQLCPPHHKLVDNEPGYLPFIDGYWFDHRMEVSHTNQNHGLQVDLFLKSGNERPLTSTWGAVHTLGPFDNNQFDEKQLVLTIHLKAYYKNGDAQVWSPMHHEPLIFFVLLPTKDHIAKQTNEIAAMDYSYQNAQLLVVDSR
ncbi:hypothetical protein [Vibrio sonorensis]|uniref:hypothetical protein n=1 Tax=Vibrio sonorensis TaxID=1004316 RepID=UPI0008DA4165|nr:hypothetical protein [Vibrio sonorensis]